MREHADQPGALRRLQPRVCSRNPLCPGGLHGPVCCGASALWGCVHDRGQRPTELRDLWGRVPGRAVLRLGGVLRELQRGALSRSAGNGMHRPADESGELRCLRHRLSRGIVLCDRSVHACVPDAARGLSGPMRGRANRSTELRQLWCALPCRYSLCGGSLRLQRRVGALLRSMCRPHERRRQLRRVWGNLPCWGVYSGAVPMPAWPDDVQRGLR
jgi:hypothetical protein